MSDGIRDWGIRLLALGIAIGIWFNASVEDRLVSSEKVVEAAVTYNRPRGFIVLNQVQNVNVRLTGSRRAIRALNPYMVDVQVDLVQRQEGQVTVSLGGDNVLAPEGLEVVSIEPNTIQVTVEREETLRVPVVPEIVGEPAAGARRNGDAEVFPNQVLVSGPASLLSKIETLSTRPVSLDGHAFTFEESATVIPPDPLIQVLQPSQVTVRVPLTPPEPAGNGPERKEEP